MAPILRVFHPHLTDVIDPNHMAVPGQVVQAVRTIGGEGETDIVIATPDGEINLGFCSPRSLKNLPRNGSLRFDKATGLTTEAKQLLA